VARRRGVAAACVLAVTDLPGVAGHERIDARRLERLGPRLGEVGYAALAGQRRTR
jgi:hypothetical protein